VHLFCVADEDTVRGFRLVGVPGEAVSTARDAAETVARALHQAGCDLLILTDEVTRHLRPQLDALRVEHKYPLVVEIPGPSGPRAGRESLRRLVQKILGTSLEKEP